MTGEVSMEAIFGLVIAGTIGGVAMALWLSRHNRLRRDNPLDTGGFESGPTDVINMAHIRVAGVGGLGLVVVAGAVAVGIPQVGKSLAAGLLLGALMAVLLIRHRRARGPMPSSGQRPGANVVLSIDTPDAAKTSAPTASEDRGARLVTARL